MRIEVIKSIKEYLYLIHQKENISFDWYRGHKETSYRLEPSLYRSKREIIEGDADIQIRHYEVNNEIIMLKEFKKGFSEKILDYKYNDLDYFYMMQHSGIDTRLLDFSSNPLIALFFSVADEKKKKDNELYYDQEENDEFNKNSSAVFCINPRKINALSSGINKIVDLSHTPFKKIRNLLTPICIEPTNTEINKRLEAQQGKFVLFGKEVHALDYYSEARKHMLKIIIPDDCRSKIRNELEKKFEINYSTVYPDLQGIKQYLKQTNTDNYIIL